MLKLLNNFNTEFQNEKSLIHLVIPRISTLFRAVARSFMIRKKVVDLEILQIDFNNRQNWLPVSEIFLGTKAEMFIQKQSMDKKVVIELRENIREFYIELLKQFLKLFKLDDPVLKDIEYFSPTVALSGVIGSILEICEHFPIFNKHAEEINNEWRLIPETEELKKFKELPIEEFWNEMGKIRTNE